MINSPRPPRRSGTRIAVVRAVLIGAAIAVSAMSFAAPPANRRNFVACPVLQDTDTVPCWLAEYRGESYFLGIQTDSGGWGPPWLGHQILVEGRLEGGPRICGGIALTSDYPAPGPPSGSSDGQPLPTPPVVSVMRELDASCNTLIPANPQFHIVGRRGPGPNTAASALRSPPPPPVPPPVARPYIAKTFTLTYEFDSELAARTIGEALNAVQYAQAVQARDITITGHRGSTLLSDGNLAREIPAIAQLRAQELARTLKKLGLPSTSTLTVRWDSQLEPADGVTDPDRRCAEIVVTP
jgi:outer membrane protein OmpA-like peptidoglycan-associated protein